ncbi:MAG: tetratricopeptide repeat protein, partial [Nitrospira sp.]|nr:tetratricopeptide repeat protein [Nitrospira sp.]
MYVMHIVRSITLLVFMVTTLEGVAQAENWLQGQILENHGDTKKPAAGAQVWIVNVGNPYLTQVDGGYRVLVPDAYRIGQTIVLYVKRRGWAIATPVGGKVELKKDFTSDIVLSPEASSEFLSPAQLDKLLESLPEKLKGLVKPDGKEGEADPAQVVKDFASEHGLPEGEVSVKIVELVKQYEQSSNLGKQCLAAIYRKDLKQAAARCEQNATRKVDLLKKKRQEVETLSKGHLRGDCPVEPSFVYVSGKVIRVTNSGKRFQPNTETRESRVPRFVVSPTGKPTPEQLDEAKRQLLKLTEEVVGEFKSTGDTYYANYQFDHALQAYREGLSYVEKKDLPTLWADMQWLIGVANWQIGIRTKDAAIQEHLAEAVNRYGAAQTIYTKTEFPEAWAEIENALGAALNGQGTRTGGEAGTQLLAQAVAAYHEALTVYTKEALPQDWAMTQNNLGGVLQEQGTRASGEAGMQLLAQAVTAYRAALTVYTKDQLPQDWAMTQNNLGVVLRDQGSRTGGEGGTQLLAQAVAAYRAALTVRTKDTLPQQWAGTQMNLGVVLKEQGTRISGEAGTQLLAQAVAAYRAALTVYTKDQLPQDWAKTQNNLGIVLRNQGVR